MSELNAEKILIETLKTNGFADVLARNIAVQYGDKLMDDFGNMVTEALGKYVERTVKQYVDDYSTEQRIKSNIQELFRRVGKDELIDLIRTPTRKEDE